MSKKIRLGYDILSKRAIETESGVNIDEALKNITSYKRVSGTGEDNHPDVARPSTKVFYIVKVDGAGNPDAYKEWIWNQPENGTGFWDCIGDTTDEQSSWKRWSEARGSTGGDQSVYIGQRNAADTSDPTYNIGDDNAVTGTAGGAEVPLAMNVGAKNIIHGEGLNLGKNNISEHFGVTLGQNNKAYHGSVSVGNMMNASYGSISIGNGDLTPDSMMTMLAMNINGKCYPTEKIKANVWPCYARATTKLLADGKYHWVELVQWPSGVYWKCIVNYELGQYLVTRNGWSSLNALHTGYFDANGNFIESSDSSHDLHTYRVVTKVYMADGSSVSTNFYASLDSSNNIVSTGQKCPFVGGYAGEVPDGGTILTQSEYNELVAGMADSTSWYNNVFVNPEDDTDGIRQTTDGTNFFNTLDVYGYDSEDGFIPYSSWNKDEQHEFYWKTVSIDDIVNHNYVAADFFEPSGANTLSATYNSIAIGKNQEVSASSIGISPSVADSVYYANDYYTYVTYAIYDQSFYQYTIDQDTGNPSSTRVTKKYIENAKFYSESTFDLSGHPVHVVANNNYVTGGSVGIFDKSATKSSTVSDGSLGLGAGLSATGNSVAIGHHSITATAGSLAAGYGSAEATNGSIAIGNSGVTARNGSFVYGMSSTADHGSFVIGANGSYADEGSVAIGHSNNATKGSTAIGRNSYATNGAFAFGVGMTSTDAGVSIGTTGGAQASGGRSAYGTIIKYKNPDNVYVPIKGQIRPKTGYTIDHVRLLTDIAYDEVSYDYAVLGIYNPTYGDYSSNSTVILYKNGVQANTVYRTNLRYSFNKTSDYWRISFTDSNGTTQYVFKAFTLESCGHDTDNIQELKEYLEIKPTTVIIDGQVYVYADGFNYPDTGRQYNNWIPLDDCTYGTSDYWTGPMLGYDTTTWDKLTKSGGYDKGVSIGANAHAQGCSFAAGPNDYTQSTTVYVSNRIMDEQNNGFPTSLGWDITSTNAPSANGYSIAIGAYNVTANGSSMAHGYENVLAQGRSMAIGIRGAYADHSSLSIGCNTNNAYNYAFAVGQNNNLASGWSFAIGTDSNTASGYSFAIGRNGNIARDYSMAVGDGSNAETNSMVMGQYSNAFHSSFAIGKWVKAFDYATAFGINASAYNYATAFGDGIQVSDYSFGVGRWGSVTEYSVGVGESNTVKSYSFATGRWNNASNRSVAIGDANTADQYAVAIGRDNNAKGENVTLGIGNGANISNYTESYGTMVGVRNTSGYGGHNVGLGRNNFSQYEAISIGTENTTSGWSIALGVQNITPYDRGSHATMIGYNNKSNSTVETRTWEDTSSSTTYYLPLNSYYDYSWSEQIYTPDEIGPSGYIGSLSFCVSSYSTTRYLNIYLANTTKNSFTGNNDWVLSSSATLVFSGSVTFNVGWNTIPLDTSFQYDDSKNLCVIVLDNTGSYSSSMYFKGMSPGDGVYRSMYVYRDGSPYNPSSSSTSGGLTDNRPFIRFLIGGSTVSVPKIVPLSGSIPTNSILMGALNESNHYNSILIGVGNQSDAPHIIQDDDHYNTNDDDGFMLAVGRENYVGRNYDIAIGYKSVAYGGENIAVQHSTARGFGNIALEQSSIAYGVRNFAMFDSSLETNSSGAEIKFNKDVLANVLVDANLIGASNIRRNTVMHTNMDTSATSTERNIIHIGVRKTSEYDDGHTVHVINAPTFNDNIVIGARNGTKVPFSSASDITLSGGGWAMDRNVLLNNAYALLSSGGGGCCDNTCISAELYIDTVYYVHDNFISNSLCQVAAPYYTLSANAFMARSEVTGSNHSYSIDRNFVFASYMHCTPDSTVSHRTSISDITSNVLFGSTASMVQRCFSFSNSYNNAGGDSAYLEYACGVVNFGDANIYDTSDVFSFGDDNEYHRIKKGVIMGNMNTVDANTEITRVTLIGNDNTIKATYGSDTAGGPLVLGDSNNIRHGKFVFDNRILGNNNYIANYVGLQKWTEQEINSITSVDYPRIFAPVHRCIRVTGTMTFLWRDMYCYYYNHSISYSYRAPSEPYTSMTASAFSTAYQNGTLTNDSFYFITTNASSLPSMTSGDFMDDKAVYHIEENSTYVRELSPDDKLYSVAKTGVFSTEDAHNASRNLIIGDSNGAYSNTVGYSILGSGNIVRNTQVSSEYKAYAISNGFVQGNNNVVTDGSNIIAMGNGHVATGHNSVAIGMQLISDQWQTVLGKYNDPIDGPDRLTPASDSSQANKAIFMIGNGYSDTDGDDWQDESQIHRSNAMVVYADGTVTAKAFVSDEPTLTLTGEVDQNGTGINVTETATTATISLDADTVAILNIIKNRPTTGRCVLESNNGTLSWVSIGTQTV